MTPGIVRKLCSLAEGSHPMRKDHHFFALGDKDAVPQSGGPVLFPSLTCLLSWILACLLTLTRPGSPTAGSGLCRPEEGEFA